MLFRSEQSTRLNRLTENLLSLGRIEGGLDSDTMPLVDVLEVLGSALVTTRQFAPGRRITKDMQIGEAIVRADASLLEQVFINILQNAVVHTPAEGPIHLEVTASTEEVVIAVEDAGAGIRHDERESIFERFHQSSASGRSQDRKSTRLNSSHTDISRMPSSA